MSPDSPAVHTPALYRCIHRLWRNFIGVVDDGGALTSAVNYVRREIFYINMWPADY